MSDVIDSLREQLPLPVDWTRPEVYSEDFRLGALRLGTVGLTSSAPGYSLVTASAAGPDDSQALSRAYYELIERVSICEARRKPDRCYELVNFKKSERKLLSAQDIFLAEESPEQWTYSKSNGVAFHYDFERAARGAALELIERDRILRSWYQNRGSRRIDLQDPQLEKDLSEYYRIELYAFGQKVSVVGVFCFPKDKRWPFVFGFGAGESQAGAMFHAQQETLQRLSFLWGEDIPLVCPDPAPSPGYHLEYYLYPENIKNIAGWLKRSSSADLSAEGLEKDSLAFENIWFADITPDHLKSKGVVVKALSEHLAPLTFGQVHPYFPDSLLTHPIA